MRDAAESRNADVDKPGFAFGERLNVADDQRDARRRGTTRLAVMI